ncbi:DUF2326 domain-containing protein [Georhizobium profundi]|uniref:DUF2326 domain-containing protein n=1 Tax=Georhizobium profundi TaxID=2341112 RepID=A0A3Q8XRX5_9HYPH|nr:DUF2326 domain-containing protein [Georhizobium profundi]AZN72288.1 DUF2326 domain-containing protein [Georhizobium profundi]
MLHRLSSDRAQFKTLAFKPGLNIILASRHEGSDSSAKRRSRNGAGKSSVLDIVHFLLGGQTEGALKSSVVKDWNFTLELDVGPERLAVTRRASDATQVAIAGSSILQSRITNSLWCKHLGEAWFGWTGKKGAGGTSYRQLISFFARRKRDGGLEDPIRTFRSQTSASSETTLAELFGLDTELVRQLHYSKAAIKKLKTAQRALADLDKAAAPGTKQADLEAQLEAQIAAVKLGRDRLNTRIESFNVLPAFRELETELVILNQRFRDLSDDDILDAESIDVNIRSLESESLSELPDLTRLFAEAEIIFPDLVGGRYAEVRRFHEQLVANRKSHLQTEISSARRRIDEREPLREAVEERRRDITKALRASGPADQLLQLRDELSDREGELRQLKGRLEDARKLEVSIEQTEADLDDAIRALRQDRRERSAIVELASTTFSQISESLYEQPGSLAISATDDGLRFLPSTPFDQSAGVMSMEIFCFDLTIALLAQRRGIGPGFLLHDSHLFEPVDGRQFAKSLQIAAQISAETEIQYIALLNSDELDRAQRESGADFSDFVLETELSDLPGGGLFGARFD